MFLAGIMTQVFGGRKVLTSITQIQSLPVNEAKFAHISTDIQHLIEEYLRPPGRRFGIIKPLTLDDSPACLKEPRHVFVPRSWLKSAINLAIEEQVSQVVESRNASSFKTKHLSWTYSSFAKP